MVELKNRPIEKIIKDFKELEFTNILGAIESGDVEEKDFAQIDKDLKELALFAESKLAAQPTAEPCGGMICDKWKCDCHTKEFQVCDICQGVGGKDKQPAAEVEPSCDVVFDKLRNIAYNAMKIRNQVNKKGCKLGEFAAGYIHELTGEIDNDEQFIAKYLVDSQALQQKPKADVELVELLKNLLGDFELGYTIEPYGLDFSKEQCRQMSARIRKLLSTQGK